MTNQIKKINEINSYPKVGPYNIAVTTSAKRITYLSGQIGNNLEGRLVSDKLSDQLRQVFSNIDGILKQLNLTKNNIVKTTIFLTTMSDFSEMNDAYAIWLGDIDFPARSTIAVHELPKSAKVEIECILAD